MTTRVRSFLTLITILTGPVVAADLPTDEAGIAELLKGKKARVTVDGDGHVTKVFSPGDLTLEELQLLGKLPHVEQLALNAPPAGDDGWAFLHDLPKLKTLTIWHGHHFATLKPFGGLEIESLTLGGCMGLRNLNKEHPERQRDAVLSLEKLPNLRKLVLYHSPLTPGDEHLAHIAKHFPKLTELRVDFAAPRGTEITVTPKGLGKLAELDLEKLTIENAHGFSAEHVAAIGEIKTLGKLEVHTRGSTVEHYRELLAPLAKPRPDIEVTYVER